MNWFTIEIELYMKMCYLGSCRIARQEKLKFIWLTCCQNRIFVDCNKMSLKIDSVHLTSTPKSQHSICFIKITPIAYVFVIQLGIPIPPPLEPLSSICLYKLYIYGQLFVQLYKRTCSCKNMSFHQEKIDKRQTQLCIF